MSLFKKFFFRKPPDGLLEISERVYVFDCCFSTDVLDGVEYKVYMEGIVAQLREHFLDASFMVFNFREGERQSEIDKILSQFDMTVMDYPRQHEGCPLLTMEMIHHFLRSSESWLSLGRQNILLMHCERGGWPVLAFMLAGLLIYRKQYSVEQRTLDMIYKQAPRELLQLLSPLNPLPSQIRYLQYISKRNVGSEWPPLNRALTLDCIILRMIPNFGEGGCRPLFRIYGQDPLIATDRTPKVLFSTPKKSKNVRLYKQADSEVVKIDIHCHIQGDVVLECISLDEDLEHEEMMFRVMFNTSFIRSNILMLNRDEIDILWDAKDRFPKGFRAEVLLSEMDSVSSITPTELASWDEKEGLPVEAFAMVQEIFNNVDWLDEKADAALHVLQQISSSNSSHVKLDRVSPQKMETGAIIQECSANTTTGNFKADEADYATETKPLTKVPALIPRSAASPTQPSLTSYTEKSSSNPSKEKLVTDSWQKVVNFATSRESNSRIFGEKARFDEICDRTENLSEPQASALLSSKSYIQNLSSDTPTIAASTTASASSANLVPPSPLPPLLAPREEQPTWPLATPSPTLLPASVSGIPPSPLSPQLPVANSVSSMHPPSSPHSSAKVRQTPIPSPPLSPLSSGPFVYSVSQELDANAQACSHPPSSGSPIKKSVSKPPPPNPPPLPASLAPSLRPLPLKTVDSTTSVPPPPLPPSMHVGFTPTIASSVPTSAPLPPPPPPSCPGSATSTIAPSAPPPPPPPCKLMTQKSSSIPDVLSPPISSGQSSLQEPDISSSQSKSMRNEESGNNVIPPPPISGRGAPYTSPSVAKGRSLNRTTSPRTSNSAYAAKRTSLKPLHWVKVTRATKGSLWAESQRPDDASKAPLIDMSELESLFSAAMPGSSDKSTRALLGPKCEKVQMIELRRANNCEIMLTKVKMPIPDLMVSSSAIGFRLDSLLKLSDTRARNNKMTLMHYLCKVIGDKLPEVLDFHKDLGSLEAAAKIQLKELAEEMQAISKGLEKVEQELTSSENDGPVSETFCRTLKEFLIVAETEVRVLTSLYSGAGRNADALAVYFGEDPARCPFEQVVCTLLTFVKMFERAHEENCKQLELERKKAQKEVEIGKMKPGTPTKKESDNFRQSAIRSGISK